LRIQSWRSTLEAAGGSVENGAGSICSRIVVGVPVAIVGPAASSDWDWRERVSAARSGCVPFVPVMQSADLRDRYDATIARLSDRAGDRRVLVQREVSP
jgi:hypothetical protein